MKFDIVVKKFFAENEIFITCSLHANLFGHIQIPQLLIDDVCPLNPLIFLQTANKMPNGFVFFSNFYFFKHFYFLFEIFLSICANAQHPQLYNILWIQMRTNTRYLLY